MRWLAIGLFALIVAGPAAAGATKGTGQRGAVQVTYTSARGNDLVLRLNVPRQLNPRRPLIDPATVRGYRLSRVVLGDRARTRDGKAVRELLSKTGRPGPDVLQIVAANLGSDHLFTGKSKIVNSAPGNRRRGLAVTTPAELALLLAALPGVTSTRQATVQLELKTTEPEAGYFGQTQEVLSRLLGKRVATPKPTPVP